MSRPAWLPAAVAALVASSALAANWPQWRGPAGDGTSPETSLPLKWSESENVVWKCPLPDGASTPAIWGDAIFATAQDGEKLIAYRIDRDAGKVAWSREIGAGTMIRRKPPTPRNARGEQKFNDLHNMASPSPVTDGEIVVFHFGNGDLAAFDFAGKQLWKHNLQTEHGHYTIWWGHSNSPVIVGDLVISVCMHDNLADLPGKTPVESYLVAHDKRTGEQRWKTPRNTDAPKEEADSYTTPLLRTVNGQQEMILMGGNHLDAYDPATGKRLWYLPDLVGGRTVTGPTLGGGLIYATRGKKEPLVAVRTNGTGKLPPDSILWSHAKETADTSSLLYHDGLLFWVTDIGSAHCVDAATGKPQWSHALYKGDYKPSPIVAAGRIYFMNLRGRCTVVAAAPEYKELAQNVVDDETIASPAAADGRLYIRGRKGLYCIKGS
jgi:outer membrane protein assembly factor BamB